MKTKIKINAMVNHITRNPQYVTSIDVNNFNLFTDKTVEMVLDDWDWEVDLIHYPKSILEGNIYDLLEMKDSDDDIWID